VMERLMYNVTRNHGVNIVPLVVFVALWALASFTASQRPTPERNRHLAVLASPAAFVLLHLVANTAINYWYFVPAAFVHAWYFLRFGPEPNALPGWAGRLAIGTVTLLFIAKWAYDTRAQGPEIRWARQFVAEVQRRVPANEPIFQIDGSGWVGWFSGRRVVNGDGLVNDHEYAQRLVEGKLGGYLEQQRIHYIVDNHAPENAKLIDDYRGLTVSMDSVEIVIAPPPGFSDFTAFGLYRLKH